MKLSEMYPKKYATGEDLNGRPVTLTISHVRAEKMRPNAGAQEETKYVVYFDGAHKGVVMSKTLAGQIAQAVGSDDTDLWPGKPVVLYPETVNVAGTPRVAIRARKPAPAAQATQTPAPTSATPAPAAEGR